MVICVFLPFFLHCSFPPWFLIISFHAVAPPPPPKNFLHDLFNVSTPSFSDSSFSSSSSFFLPFLHSHLPSHHRYCLVIASRCSTTFFFVHPGVFFSSPPLPPLLLGPRNPNFPPTLFFFLFLFLLLLLLLLTRLSLNHQSPRRWRRKKSQDFLINQGRERVCVCGKGSERS